MIKDKFLFHITTYSVQHQRIEDHKTAFIRLILLPSRPLPWAKGTYFNPMVDGRNGICIQVSVDTEIRAKNYRLLVSWMKRNVNTGEAIELGFQKAGQLWTNNQSL
jgi:hypothetical protein